jgi:2-iminobutanoate/2-iminopropanoate deaminase
MFLFELKGEYIMKTVSTNKAPGAVGPYSQAQISGNFVFCSGQIAIIPETGEVAVGLEAQANQVFKNVSEVLKAAGSDISKVVKTTVFIKDMNDFGAVNAIYANYFTEPFPARSCVEVARLPKDVLLECEVIAEI